MHGLDFVAIDVETANESPGSICQVGLARFVNGKLADTMEILVNPESYFAQGCINVHGLTAEICASAPTFRKSHPSIREFIRGGVMVCHTHFDRVALQRACHQHQVDHLPGTWLDTARVARRTWDLPSYGLRSLCAHIDHKLDRHHNALHDAIAAGEILVACCRHTGLELHQIPKTLSVPATGGRTNPKISRAGDPSGPFAGETICFTGSLRIVRTEAAALAAQLGFDVVDPMNLKTTVLVVGDQDVLAHRGENTSSKMRKAEEMTAKGLPIRVVAETEFFAMVSPAPSSVA